MVYQVTQKIGKRQEKKVLEAYYEFFTRMYGLVSLRFFGRPNFTTNVDNHDFWERGDSNFQKALEILNAKEGTYNFLMGFGDLSAESLKFIARIRAEMTELIASEIVLMPEERTNAVDLVQACTSILEKIAQENRLTNVVIEVPVRDEVILAALTNLGYEVDRSEDDPNKKYATMLLSKNVPLLESSEAYGRTRSNK